MYDAVWWYHHDYFITGATTTSGKRLDNRQDEFSVRIKEWNALTLSHKGRRLRVATAASTEYKSVEYGHSLDHNVVASISSQHPPSMLHWVKKKGQGRILLFRTCQGGIDSCCEVEEEGAW